MAFGGGGIPTELGSELPDVFTDVRSRLRFSLSLDNSGGLFCGWANIRTRMLVSKVSPAIVTSSYSLLHGLPMPSRPRRARFWQSHPPKVLWLALAPIALPYRVPTP